MADTSASETPEEPDIRLRMSGGTEVKLTQAELMKQMDHWLPGKKVPQYIFRIVRLDHFKVIVGLMGFHQL